MKQTIYAAIGIGEDEGIIVLGNEQTTPMPLICMDEDLLPGLHKAAKFVQEVSSKEVVIARFDLTEVIERYNGSRL